MATHKISYGVVYASALERMRTGRTMRALKQTATDRGIRFSNMIKPGHICGGSHFSRTIILSESSTDSDGMDSTCLCRSLLSL